MNLFPRSRSLNDTKPLGLPLLILMFFLPTLLPGQEVHVTISGGTSNPLTNQIYFGQYVAQTMDLGFIWLDSTALTGGHVPVLGKCNPGIPIPVTNLYTIGDCNSISDIAGNGGTLIVHNWSGQCGSVQRGCGGPREGTQWPWGFTMGTWQFLGPVPDAPDTGQTRDLQGRTWALRRIDGSHYVWHVTGGGPTPTPTPTRTPAFTPTPTPTPTPGPAARATNLSSQTRGDSVNYYGDRWQLEDISNPNPTRTDWDFNYDGSFHSDEFGTPGPPDNEGTVTGYFPCDPSGASVGSFRTGGNCRQSLGLANPPATFSYRFALLSSVSADPVVSPAFQVVCPQANIAGFTGFPAGSTCTKPGGTLTVLTGGIADARGSLGNLSEAQFDWTFPGTPTPNVSGQAPAVPAGATTFTLTITFPGGYQATADGAIVFVTSAPILGVFTDAAATRPAGFFGGAFQLTAGTPYWLKDTEVPAPPQAHFLFNGGAGYVELPGSPTSGPGPLAWTPNAVCNSGCLLRVTVGNLSDSIPVVISPAAQPTPVPTATPPPGNPVTVSIQGPTSGQRGVPLTFTAFASGGNSPYTYAWQCDYNPLGGFSPQSSQTTCTYSLAGTHNVKVLVRDSVGASALSPDFFVSIFGLPAPSANYEVTGATPNPIGNRFSAPTGTPITFTSLETHAASYQWTFGDGNSASTKAATHAFSAAGAYTVVMTVTGDETNTSGTTSTSIPVDITGPPLPSTAYSVAGATQTGANAYTAEAGRALTFTAQTTQASSYAWDFGDETRTGKSVTKTYSAAGPRTVRLAITGDGTNTSGTASVDIAMAVTPPSFRAAIVPGAAHLDDGTTTWGTDVSITNGGTASVNIRLAFLPLLPESDAPPSLDLTQLNYGPPIPLSPGASYSVGDVVAVLNGGNNKGTLVIKYSPGTQAPLVSARVYFQPKVNPGNVSYGSGIPTYEVDGSGRISPQGFTPAARFEAPHGLQTESETETLDFSATVNLTGSGSGTVTSSPAGINCPPTCSASFPVGSSVLLNGRAATGSVFYGFVAGCDYTFQGQCGLDMFAGKTVTAQFDSSGPTPPPTPTPTPGPGNFTLSVTKGGTGSGTVSSSPSGINCGATCSVVFAQATAVTLTAAPDSGSTFSGWGGACSGTGTCTLTMSANQSATATFSVVSAPPPSGDQFLIGLQSDPRYRFAVTLFNAGATQGNFELRATDDQGALVSILDASGSLVTSRKFNNLGPYQQVYLRDIDLFRENDLGLGKHYVLKATATKGTLLAFGTALDRKTLDLVQISDDSQVSPAENESVSYWVAGVSRFDSAYGARWRTDLRIFNRGSNPRNLSFQYFFSSDGVTEHVAEVANLSIKAGALLNYDDVVSALLATDTRVDLSGSSAGILRIFYPEDDESATRPLVIGSRNYDDQPTGTAGSQLAVYTNAQAGSATRDLFLTGVEDSARYASRIGVFAMDPGPVTGRIVVVAPDGSEVGSVGFELGGGKPRYGQISLTDPNMNFTNPGKPVSIRFEQLGGGRVGAYAFTADKVTLDTNFLQGLPKN